MVWEAESPRAPDAVADESAPSNLSAAELRAKVAGAAERVAALGSWPQGPEIDSLSGRVPTDTTPAAGFDAGVACALDLIPRNRQRLAATLHAAYTEHAIAQVRGEAARLTPDTETTWWLSACSVSEERDVRFDEFRRQLQRFEWLRDDVSRRVDAARGELERMESLFVIRDEIPFTDADGGVQGAYIAGYPVAVEHASGAGIYFIGTYKESLGLESFEWSSEVDRRGRPRSGPVHGSRQFVKCANEDELERALAAIKDRRGHRER